MSCIVLSKEEKQRIIREYLNPKSPYAYSGVNKLYHYAKTHIKSTTTVSDIRKLLSEHEAYTLHKTKRKNFPRSKTRVYALDELIQMDLADMSNLRNYNRGVTFLLFIIESLSRLLYVYPLKNKTCTSVANALETYFKQARLPWKLLTDKDKSFFCKDVQRVLNSRDIVHYTTQNSEIKAAQAERVIRTIKSRLYKFMTATGSRTYIDALPDIVTAYNNTVHSVTGMKPVHVNYSNQQKVLKHVYQNDTYKKPSFQVNDTVRLSLNRQAFGKGYAEQWTKEVFRITKVYKKPIPVYGISDLQGEPVLGTFYPHELQLITIKDRDILTPDRILQRRRRGRNWWYLVAFKGLPDTFNKWIPRQQYQKERKQS